MKNKFAFDLPRLKIGASKVETKTPKETPIGFDSPPPTPKSVRPPLSPRADYELRTACALILQEYKPSDVIYEEQYGDLQDNDLQDAQEDREYEIVRSALEREVESPLAPVNTTTTRTMRQRTMSGDRLSERHRYDMRPMVERSPQSDDSRQSRGHRRSLLERAEDLRSRLHLEAEPPAEDGPHHRRSVSSPLVLGDLPLRNEHAERSGAPLRSDSTMAERTTPGTEDEEYYWPASTAPTTAGITPAHTSNRTSNVLRESANNSTAKFLASDTEWMREELEKYKKVQKESHPRQDSDENAGASTAVSQEGEMKESFGVQAPPVAQIPARKPVPRPDVESRQSTTPHSRPSGELSRSGSKRRPTPRSESRAEMVLLRPESRQADDDDDDDDNIEVETETIPIYNATASRSFHRKPLSGIAAPLPSHNVSQAGSRSRSLTRQIREYIRPSSRIQSREISRPESRARSIESFASSTSNLTPSVDSSSKWRRWKPFHRNRDSSGTDDFSRPDSRDSSKRGRAFSQDSTAASQRDKVNLNRELPPLPSLDQWKDADAAPVPAEDEHESVDRMATWNTSNGISIIPPMPPRSQKPSVDSTTSRQPRDSVLVDNTLRIFPKRTTSLRARKDIQHPPAEPISASLPQSPGVDAQEARDLRQSQSIKEFSPKADGNWTIVPTTPGVEKPVVPPKDHALNYPLPSGKVNRTMSQRMPIASRRSGTSNTDLHARTISDQQFNFSRKLSSEDYNRMHDVRYKNAMQTPPRKPVPTQTTVPPETEQPKKKKWWQSGRLKKSRQSWMQLS